MLFKKQTSAISSFGKKAFSFGKSLFSKASLPVTSYRQVGGTGLDLNDVLKTSYKKQSDQKNALSKHGYEFDSSLSNGNQQIYYNPTTKKLINSVTGTHNLSDWGTDAMLAVGNLKGSKRYKEADNTLKNAKKKYGVESATVVGHSLGGSIGQGIASKNDQFFGLDSGYTIGQKTRSNNGNFHHFRTKGDAVSLLSGNSSNMQTLNNPNKSSGLIPLDALRAHNINNIAPGAITI